jgi:hypothetical protein
MVQEITLKQNGTVTRCEKGVLFDPVLSIRLNIDAGGIITSGDNPSVSGRMNGDGSFYWSGTMDIAGRLNKVLVKGTLEFLPRDARAGKEYDGLYHMTDTGTGREQLVRVSDGFYNWKYVEEEAGGEGFAPWPTMVKPDGSFAFNLELTTVLEMGTMGKADYSTAFFSEGKIIPGKSVSIREYSKTAGMGQSPSDEKPHIYSGGLARQGEYPNEEIPEDTGEKLNNALYSPAQEIDWSQYPDWYLRPPQSDTLMYAVGEKTFNDKSVALAMAEAAAAADIAVRIRLQVNRSSSAAFDERGQSANTVVTSESSQRLAYKVVKSFYNEQTKTAFVLAQEN